MSQKNTIFDDDEDYPCVPTNHQNPPRWKSVPLGVNKFIDDLNTPEKCNLTAARSEFTTNKEQQFVHATECQRFLNTVMENAARIGMVVNPLKTQLLCTTTAINYDVRSFIIVEGKEILSSDTLKSVGFTFGRRLGAGDHMKTIRRKDRDR